jgi:Glycosyl transferase family 2
MDSLQSLAGRIQIFRQSNRGPGAARNFGSRHASGTYLAFLDSEWFPWTLKAHRDVIHKYGRPSFVGGSAVPVFGQVRREWLLEKRAA